MTTAISPALSGIKPGDVIFLPGTVETRRIEKKARKKVYFRSRLGGRGCFQKKVSVALLADLVEEGWKKRS